ncbi:stress-induced-phosphoprotein 1 [Neoarius graeffei]|uniref:stress-induced-phosphoprotein 1 n=1 Tax=Neoarius graeffei TaxID=443677 RepID=UPI00298C5BB3|nr:stress-induced-phosphoprotein 1 [Neoarius graeffei]
MSNRNGFGPGYFRMLENTRLMQAHEAMVDLIKGNTPQYDILFNTLGYGSGLGLDSPDDLEAYEDLTDDDEDDEYGRRNNRYCGFTQNFLDKRGSQQLPAIRHYKSARCITPEEAAKNAKELVAEEEKLKKKAEKKKQKKMRQRERRRLEKLEKENGNKDSAKQDAAAVPVKSKPTEKECENRKKRNNSVPPHPDPQCDSVAPESSDSCDDNDDDDQESIADDLELDMNSCFVTNAAAIAKRKLEQKPDKKDKKAENSKKHETAQKNTAEPKMKNVNEKVPSASEEPVKDNVTKSMELAVMGNKYAQTGNLDMAVKYFTDAIKHNPQEVKLFGNRSFCYEKMQQYEKALIDADIALSLNPTWIKGLYRKGKALVGLKRYYEASLTYKEVLKIDSSCTDAAQELMRVQIMQLMDMGYTREQSSNALIIHGTVEKALEALSGLHGNMAAAQLQVEEVRVYPERNTQPVKVPLGPVPQNPPKVSTAVPATIELFPVWVGDLVPAISELKLHELFSNFGPVHSVKLLSARRCAFVNYINKEDCERAIREMNGFRIAETCLVVRYPDRIHTHLGVSKAATTDTGKVNKFPDECYFWRTTGCIKNNRCSYRHVPEHKGIDRPKFK